MLFITPIFTLYSPQHHIFVILRIINLLFYLYSPQPLDINSKYMYMYMYLGTNEYVTNYNLFL